MSADGLAFVGLNYMGVAGACGGYKCEWVAAAGRGEWVRIWVKCLDVYFWDWLWDGVRRCGCNDAFGILCPP